MKMSAENPEKDKTITASDIARMTDAEVLEALRSLLDKNMAEFDATLEGLTKEEIAEMPEVAATRDIYCFLQYDYDLERRDAELLLRMDNPLQFNVDNWPCYNLTELAMDALGEGPVKEAEKKEQPKQDARDTAAAKKPSILERLKAKGRALSHRSVQKEHQKGGEAR